MHALARPVAAMAAAVVIISALLPWSALAASSSSRAAATAGPRLTAAKSTTIAPRAGATSPATIDCSAGCDLWAKSGTTTLPGPTSVEILGFSATELGDPAVPGPTIDVTQGATVSVTLHNTLGESVSLAFAGQALAPDVIGAAPSGGTKSYTFTASTAGTFLYEAGLTSRGARQVAMGLFGALVVRPAGSPPTAYGDVATAYDREAIFVFNGIDAAINGAYPSTVDMSTYHPAFWMVNGMGYPDNPTLRVGQGERLLVRLINAGLSEESVGLVGLRQSIVATDGQRQPTADLVAQTVAPGATIDSIINIPADSVGARYVLMSASGHSFNGPSAGTQVPFGGFVQLIEVVADPDPPVTAGLPLIQPTASGIAIRVTATASDASSGGSAIAAGEWFDGTDPGAGNGHAMTVAATGASSAQLSATVDVNRLGAGLHSIGVRAQDAAGNWSRTAASSVTVARLLYRNGFDTGLGRWASVTARSRLKVAPAAALDGARGLRVGLAGIRPAFVVDASPGRLAAYRARFLFAPHARTGASPIDLLVGRDASARDLFRVQFRQVGGAAQVRLTARTARGRLTGSWVSIANRSQSIEILWAAGTSGKVRLLVDGSVKSTLTGNTRTYRLRSIALGAVTGSRGAAGSFDLDAFASTRGEAFVR